MHRRAQVGDRRGAARQQALAGAPRGVGARPPRARAALGLRAPGAAA
jgi:hypothetical protein